MHLNDGGVFKHDRAVPLHGAVLSLLFLHFPCISLHFSLKLQNSASFWLIFPAFPFISISFWLIFGENRQVFLGYGLIEFPRSLWYAISSKADEFCTKADEFCTKNDELCTKNDEFSTTADGLCTEKRRILY